MKPKISIVTVESHSVCRACGSDISKGDDVLYTFSDVYRSHHSLYCMDCVQWICGLKETYDASN